MGFDRGRKGDRGGRGRDKRDSFGGGEEFAGAGLSDRGGFAGGGPNGGGFRRGPGGGGGGPMAMLNGERELVIAEWTPRS